jgi:hypothetical protein
VQPETKLFSAREFPSWAEAWDRLPATRGIQADLYDTHLWLSAWLDAQPPAAQDALRIVAVTEGTNLLAALAMSEVGRGRWEVAGRRFRPRFRPVLSGQADLETSCGLLAEALRREDVREVSFPGLPSRDPASHAWVAALRRAGYLVELHAGPDECLAPVAEGGWEQHKRQFKKYDRTVKNFSNKASRLGPVELIAFGGNGHPLIDGFDSYLALHARGWKGELKQPMRTHRRLLFERTQAAGIGRMYLLRVAGVPTAAIIWFLVGEVAIAYSTVYDQRLAALSAGTIVMWQAHEHVMSGSAIRLIDYLPGHGPQKDQLATDRPGLQRVEAMRRSAVSFATSSVFKLARRVAHAARDRWPARRPQEQPQGTQPVRCAVLKFDAAESPLAVSPLAQLDPQTELFLAVAGGHSSPAAMTRTWTDGTQWWRIGADAAPAFMRLEGTTIRELITSSELSLERAAHAVALSLGAALTAHLADPAGTAVAPAVIVQRSPLPWLNEVASKS